MDSYLQLEANILAWAENQPLLNAIVVVGSRARKDHSADHLSDLDMILFTPNPEAFEADGAWIGSIADVWLAVCDLTGHGDPEWLVFFEGGFKADFIIVRTSGEIPLPTVIERSSYKSVFGRGFRVLYNQADPNIKIKLLEMPQISIEIPTEVDLSNTVNRALIHATRLAVFLERKDHWRSHQILDLAIRNQLLKLLEWYTQSSTSNLVDTWYDGRFIDMWADPKIVANISETFATYNELSLQMAFVKTVDLINTLATETSRQLDYHVPSQGQTKTIAWLRDLPIYKKNGRDRI